tara:strand:- start:1728 stop:1970 length:243 start_codon:yes stop_codon:yes gene_type:complete
MDDLFKNIQDNEDDIELADEAMRNTYSFIMNGYDWDSLPEAFWMLDDPESKQAIKDLIEYFTETEEYEKCAKLVKLIKKK